MKMRIAIIGGGGKMGQWLARWLTDEDFSVIIADKDAKSLKTAFKSPLIETTADCLKAAAGAKIIIISVPIDKFEAAVREIGPAVRPGSIVADVTSVKARPVALMHEYIKEGHILGAHPLFGPNVSGLSGQNIVLSPINEEEKNLAAEARQFLEEYGANVSLMEPAAHDKMMAVVQGLSHFTAIAAADALAGLGTLKDMKAAATTTFGIFLNYIESVIGDDPELYAAIQMEHPEMPEIYNKLADSIKKFGSWVENKDAGSFVQRMRELKVYLEK